MEGSYICSPSVSWMGFLVCLNNLNVWALLYCSADTSTRECALWQVASLWEVMHTGAVELPSLSIYRLGSKYACAYTQADNTRPIRLFYEKTNKQKMCFKFTLNFFKWSIVCKQLNTCSVMIDDAIGCIPSPSSGMSLWHLSYLFYCIAAKSKKLT